MNRPSLKTYLIGNPISCLVIVCGCGYVIYRWFTSDGEMGWPVPVIAAMVAMSAIDAAGKISDYRAWKRAWDALGGEPSAVSRRNTLQAGRAAIVAASYVSLVIALSDPSIGSSSTRQLLALLFGLMTLAFIVAGIRWVLRRTQKQGSAASKDHIVTPTLPPARHSTTPIQALDRVPDYCRVLIEASRTENARSTGSR